MATRDYSSFFKYKDHNSAANHSTGTNFKLDLRSHKMHLHSEFHLKMFMFDRDTEQKLKKKKYWIFSKSKENNSARNVLTEPKLNSTCVFS